MEEFFGFIISLCILFLCCYTLYIFYRFYKGIDSLLKICIYNKHFYEKQKEKTEDIEDYFTYSGYLDINNLIFTSIFANFKFLFTKKGWSKYENNWNSRS